MLTGRIIQAIGATMTFVTNVSMITAEIPIQNRGHALGINVTGVYLGITISPTISGILVHNLSWRVVFLITVIMALISYFLLTKIDKEWIMEKEDLDKVGSLIYVIAVGLLLYAFSILNTTTGIVLLAISLVLLMIFVRYELKHENPVYEMRLFKNINYTTSNIVAMIAYLSTYVVSYVLNYHFQYILGLDAQTSGLILISTPVMMLLIAAQAGKLSDRIYPELLQLLGITLITIAIALLSQISYTTPIYVIVIAMIIQGIGHGFFSTPNNNIILSSVDNKKDIPTASASVATVRNLGQAFSLGILTVTFAFIMGNVEITPSNYHLLVLSNQTTLIIISILSVISIILSVIALKNRLKNKSS
jgi:MFS family permease